MFGSGCASQLSAVLDESQKEQEATFAFLNQDGSNAIAVQSTTLFHMSPSFQLGPRLSYQELTGGGTSISALVAGAEARLNLKTEGEMLPFVGGSVNLVRVSADDGFAEASETGIAYTLNGGIRVPVSPGAFMVTKLQFTAASINDVDQDNFGVFAGYAVRF